MAKPTRTFGLQPVKSRTGASPGELQTYPLTGAAGTGTDTALHDGDPVMVSAGQLQQATDENAIGVFRGGAYNDTNNYLQFKKRIPAGQTSQTGNVEGWPFAIGYVEEFTGDNEFMIVCDASVSVGDIGYYFAVTVSAADEVGTTLGLSSAYLAKGSRAVVPTTDIRYKMVGLWNTPGNVPYEATSNPIVIVRPLDERGVIVSAQ